MTTHGDDEDFRTRKKQARILGYDAEAWIKAKREEREQFKAAEGRDMDGLDKLANDPFMDMTHKAHQQKQADLETKDLDKALAANQRRRSEEVLQEEVKKLSEQKQQEPGNQESQIQDQQNHALKSGRSM